MEELNERHAKAAEEAELKRKQEVKEQTEWLESFMSEKQDVRVKLLAKRTPRGGSCGPHRAWAIARSSGEFR